MAARAALQCADWTTASAAYAKILGSWPEFESEQPAVATSDRARDGVACIDSIHREYCLALLRAAECSSVGASVKPTTNDCAAEHGESNSHDDATRKRYTAVALCEHVLKYRPNDVILLLLLSEAQYDLGQFEQALSAARIATQTLELLKSLELRHGHGQDKEKDTSRCSVHEELLATLAACGLDGCSPEQKSGLASQLESLLAESYHQRAAVLWRLGRHDEAIDSHFLADRCLRVQNSEARGGAEEYAQSQPLSASNAKVAELQDRVIFALTLALWARGRCQEAAERW
jgi:tetratricopeptide (TPR) repeat protein